MNAHLCNQNCTYRSAAPHHFILVSAANLLKNTSLFITSFGHFNVKTMDLITTRVAITLNQARLLISQQTQTGIKMYPLLWYTWNMHVHHEHTFGLMHWTYLQRVFLQSTPWIQIVSSYNLGRAEHDAFIFGSCTKNAPSLLRRNKKKAVLRKGLTQYKGELYVGFTGQTTRLPKSTT